MRITGTVIDIYQPRQGEPWGIATVTVGDDESVIEKVVGAVGMARVGERLEAEGAWVDDRRYGRQFKAGEVDILPPTKLPAIARFLAATVSGIGESRALKIVEHFGPETMAILDMSPSRLREVKGIPSIDRVIESYQAVRCTKHRDVLLYLTAAGIGPKLASRIIERYGDNAKTRIEADPYALTNDFAGVGFVTCDKIADQIGIPADDGRRVRAALVYHLSEECEGQGHTHLPTEGLVDRLGTLMRKTRDVSTLAIRTFLAELLSEGVIVFEDARLYSARTHRAERAVAERLAVLVGNRGEPRGDEAEEGIASVEAEGRIRLTDEQRTAVFEATAGGITVLTGGPGTGKSATTRAILRAFDAMGHTYALCAPTGKAAARCTEATGVPATTVHRLLGYREGGFEYNADNHLYLDVLVVDETSMVDLSLMGAIVAALPPAASLVLVGDVDQLPSVQPGDVLNDVIKSGAATVVTLTTIHRQGKGSAISLAAAAVNSGKVPAGPSPLADPDAEFAILPLEHGPDIADAVVDLVLRARTLWGVDPVSEVQVLTPMRKHACGVYELNRRLQDALNPHFTDELMTKRGDRFRPGDKVMQTKNDYEREVVNGMVGRVAEVHPGDGQLLVDFDGQVVTYEPEDLAHLVLSYACTVHKFQGSEIPVVVFPLEPAHWFMQFRALVYTGVTRAKKRCVLVGDVKKAATRYRSKKRDERTTWLAERLRIATGR